MELGVGSDNLMRLSALRDARTDALVSDAVVTATIRADSDDTGGVAGTTWPLTLAAVGGEPGEYEGEVPFGLSLVEGHTYAIDVLAVATGLHRLFRVTARAVIRPT